MKARANLADFSPKTRVTHGMTGWTGAVLASRILRGCVRVNVRWDSGSISEDVPSWMLRLGSRDESDNPKE